MAITEIFHLYDQMVADSDQYIVVDLEYNAKRPGETDPDGNHRIALTLRRSDDELSFADILIEFRDGQPAIYVWADPEGIAFEDPHVFMPDLSKTPYCLKCGADWEVHNDDGSCVEEN